MNRWSKNGVLERVFEQLQRAQDCAPQARAVALDSTIVKVHPDGTGALKKKDPSRSASPVADGPPRFIWLPRMLARRYVCALPGTGPRRAGGAQAAPAPRSATESSVFTDGPRLRRQRDTPTGAGAGVRARCSALSRPVSTPGSTTGRCTRGATKSNACSAGLKGFRRIFSRFEKLDALFLGFILFALIFDALC